MKGPDAFLVVAHAQHPLEDGMRPGADFRARLDKAAERFTVLRTGESNKVLYVPGSLHRGDAVSLSTAGTKYLTRYHNIKGDVLHGDDWNEAFRGDDGVYCAADEVDVALQGLAELCERRGAKKRQVVAVSALGQVARLKLHYEGFGVRPDELTIVTVGSDTIHDGAMERLLTLYTQIDQRWRGTLPNMVRSTRRPRLSLSVDSETTTS